MSELQLPVDVARYRRLQEELEVAENHELMVAREATRLAIASNCGYQRPDLEALLLGWAALNRESEALAEDIDEVWQAWARQQSAEAGR